MSGGITESDRTVSSPDVLIIGGGVAGLSAAVDLASQGYTVVLIEQKPRLGGRTYSFRHSETGYDVDNGQHLMMGCYTSTLRFIKKIGSLDTVRIQKNLSIVFKHIGGRSSELRAAPLPAPMNILIGLLRLASISFQQRLALLRVGIALIFMNPDNNAHLKSITVAQWLEELHQPPENKKYLWDIIAVGALNDSPEKISAALFAKVLKSAFFGSRKNSSMVIPTKGLSSVLTDQASRYIKNHKGKIVLNSTVEKINYRGSAIESLLLGDGQTIKPNAVVSAVPYFDISRVFGGGGETGITGLDKFVSSPIVTLHLWYDTHFMHEEFVALLDSPLHWVFNKSKMYGMEEGALLYLSIVISGAGSIVDESKEALAALAHEELKKYYPAASAAAIVHALVIKEKRATFSPLVGNEEYRPSHTTSIRNLFLAGDWTDTKLPATIEGAIQSGFACSALVQMFFKTNNPD